MNRELPDVQAGFWKDRGTRDVLAETANICCIIEKAREFQKNIYSCFIDYSESFDYVDHNKLWKIFKVMEIPDYLTCSLRNLYAGQEATVRIRYRTIVVFVAQLCLTLCNPWTIARQAPLSIGFSRQEYWSGLPFLFLGESFQPRDQTWVFCITVRFFTIWATGETWTGSKLGKSTSRLYVVTWLI